MLKIKGLTPLEQYRLRVAHKPEIIESTLAPGVVCFSVMKGVGNADTYNDAWTREARGITFSTPTGEILSRPFHKFFNVGERESTLPHNLDWDKVVRVMDKRDGSMIHPFIDNSGKLWLKSKKVVDSEVAIEATKFLTPTLSIFCKTLLIDYDATPIFEWTSPHQRIVLGYEKPELKLLHIRSNVTGEYWSRFLIDQICKDFTGIPTVDDTQEFNSFEEMIEAGKTRENIEGWVIQFNDGEMVKVKTDWYMARHRAFTFFRERDIVRLILDEQIDDVKSMFVKDGVSIDSILEIERRVAEDMKSIMASTESFYEDVKHLTAKEAVGKLGKNPFFGLVMSKVNGKTPKYVDYFEKNFFKQKYGLNTLKEQIQPLMGDDE